MYLMLTRHQPANIPVQLSDEIASSLRTLKPEGNLAKEHFKLYEAKNMIEARVPVKRKNRNVVKQVESHDYKRFK